MNNIQDLSDTEMKVIYMMRKMELFDKMDLKYAKRGEIQIQLTKTERGTYERPEDLT